MILSSSEILQNTFRGFNELGLTLGENKKLNLRAAARVAKLEFENNEFYAYLDNIDSKLQIKLLYTE